jgi:hypothetical protein
LLLSLAVTVTTSGAALAKDPIVGHWVGQASQPDSNTFDASLTFVSPKGGVSRYPGIPCGAQLEGGPKGDAYEYSETVTWGGPDEQANGGCVNGTLHLEVNGNTMKYEWSATHDGRSYTASGELQRAK